jgi:hypothetical protein
MTGAFDIQAVLFFTGNPFKPAEYPRPSDLFAIIPHDVFMMIRVMPILPFGIFTAPKYCQYEKH